MRREPEEPGPHKVIFSVCVSAATKAELDKATREFGRTRTDLTRRLIEAGLRALNEQRPVDPAQVRPTRVLELA